MIQHEDNEREARDASRELGIAMAIVFGFIGLAVVTVMLIP